MGEFAHPADASLHPQDSVEPRAFGRYVLYAPIARGGMATIHIARLVGDDGFSRIVAAKRLHPHFTEDPEFIAMFRDEAEIASKIHHPNVVPVLDIVLDGDEVVLVQEYVHGVPLDRLFRAACATGEGIPVRVVVGIAAGILAGLHAAHETTDERGEPLGVVHRDVSPQNVMVSVDGIPRLLDFGIAKASSSAHVTREGLLKGKLAYMAPEQLRGEESTRATDIYACGVVLWELLTMRRMHAGRTDAQILAAVLQGEAPRLAAAFAPVPGALPRAKDALPADRRAVIERLDALVARATASTPKERYATAAEMLSALLRAAPAASALEVAAWVKARGADYLERRQQVLASNEESWRSLSKIVAASPGPQSGVTRVKGEARTMVSREAPTLAPPQAPPEAPAPGAETGIEVRAGVRRVPWVIAGASVLVSGALLAMLSARRAAPIEAEPAVQAPVAAAPVPEPVVPPEPAAASSSAAGVASAGATSFLALPPSPSSAAPPAVAPAATATASSRAVRTPVFAPARRAEAPAVAVHAAPAPATAAAPPRADCDPPFYFEGTKKVFKPSCI